MIELRKKIPIEDIYLYLRPKYFVRQTLEVLEFDNAQTAAAMRRAAARSLINCGKHVLNGGFNSRYPGEEIEVYGKSTDLSR